MGVETFSNGTPIDLRPSLTHLKFKRLTTLVWGLKSIVMDRCYPEGNPVLDGIDLYKCKYIYMNIILYITSNHKKKMIKHLYYIWSFLFSL
jgi:hypothetical protein